MKMQDSDLMPFGEHKGKPMANVPDSYLQWCWAYFGPDFKKGKLKDKKNLIRVMEYIQDNLAAINANLKK